MAASSGSSASGGGHPGQPQSDNPPQPSGSPSPTPSRPPVQPSTPAPNGPLAALPQQPVTPPGLPSAPPPPPNGPPLAPPQAQPSSPLRSKSNWATIVVLPLIGGLLIWLVQGGGAWLKNEVTGPAELAVHGEQPNSCARYIEEPKKGFEVPPNGLGSVGRSATISEGQPADFLITLQGRNAQAIVVTGVEVKVLSSKPLPKSGFLVADGCGALMNPRTFAVKFSGSSASTEPVPDVQGKKVDFPLQVSDSDPEFIDLQLLPGNHDIRYTVEVKWLSDGEPGGKLLDNDGAGYRIMGRGELPKYGLFEGNLVHMP